MSFRERLPSILIVALVIGGLAVFISKFISSDAEAVIVEVKVPELSRIAQRGKDGFDSNCAQCHGTNASGSDQGPPLVHNIYNPGHHADQAFFLAAQRGVRRHHWSFGDMPQQPQIKERQMKEIVQYVRELQRANGIFTQEHRM